MTPEQEAGPLLIHACRIQRTRLTCTLRLTDGVEAVVRYDGTGLGYETVYLDGEVAAREIGRAWMVPHFEFVIPAPRGPLPASVDVEVSYSLALRRLRLTVGGRIVYEESNYGRDITIGHLPDALPIPVSGSAEAAGLPIPADANVEPAGALPVPCEP